jgi:glycosyltransferase involved in cell wall biosynthesis
MGNPIPAPKICLFLPSLDGGGAERVFVQLANEFAALGLRVHLVLAAARGPYLEDVAEGVRIVDLAAGGVMRSLPKLVSHLRSERPNALLSALDHANIIALLACRMSRTGTRCVISMRSVPSAVYREERFARRWLAPMLMRRFYRLADRIIANSHAVASDLIGNFCVPAEKVSVIYNPLDLDSISRLSREAVESPWLSLNSSPLILAVGRLDVLKDFPTLIRAFSIVRSNRPCRLAILGEGAGRRDLEDLVDQLQLRKDVYLPGFIDNPFAWMRAANVVVSSSLTEGCPNAVMQALACGTAVVSTDSVGGCSEILEGGRWGRLVPVKDSQAMANSILAAIDGVQRVDVRARAADFALNGVARSYLQQLIPAAAAATAER